MNNDILKTLSYPGVDLNEVIEQQAKQQTGVVGFHSDDNRFNVKDQNRGGKAYQKSKVRSSISKRHK